MPDKIEPFLLIQGAGGSPEGGQSTPRVVSEAPEGIELRAISGVSIPRVVSLSEVRTLDLISEGPIEGLVSGEYRFFGQLGHTGYVSAEFIPYSFKTINGTSVNWLRSIYLNETPILDRDGLFNYQQIDIKWTPGNPNGSTIDDIVDELEVSRSVGERLRGPNSTISQAGDVQIIGSSEAYAKSYRILNKECKAINVNVRVNALSETVLQGATQGDIIGSTVEYLIYYRPLFSEIPTVGVENIGSDGQAAYILGKKEKIQGKVSFGYIRSTRINFNISYLDIPTFIGWSIKIIRTTPDSIQAILRNQTFIDSITEIYGESFAYPNSAIVAQKFSAEYFSQVPSRAFDVRGLKVKIPSNYDPIRKSYTGIWDGTFAETKQWTDNPAWCFYDLVTNPRYGLGKYIDESLVDKLTLYEISQYCDVLVSDGQGGLEPRFTCNLIFTTREEAYKVLNDMASIFRAILYYASGNIYASQDSQKIAVTQFTNANVEDGNFTYSSSSKRVRHSVAIVRYNDKYDFFRPAIEYVEDIDNIRKYGIRELEVAAFGCTSRGQAIRFGKWALLSEGLETDAISFTAGLEGAWLRPGDVVQIFDVNKKSKRHGGRTSQIDIDSNKAIINLDDQIVLKPAVIYKFSLLSPSYFYDTSLVTGLTSEDAKSIRRSQIQTVQFSGGQAIGITGFSNTAQTQITFNNTLNNYFNTNDYSYNDNLIWMVETTGVNLQDIDYQSQFSRYRVVRVEEREPHKYAVAGIQYDESKYATIESGLKLDTFISDVIPPTPDNLLLSITNLSNNTKQINYELQVSNFTGVSSFIIYGKKDDWTVADFSERLNLGDVNIPTETPDSRHVISILPTSGISGTYIPLNNGRYYFRAYSRNITNVPSTTSASANIEVAGINPLQDLSIYSLDLEDKGFDGLRITKNSGEYNVDSPTFTWQSSFLTNNSELSKSDLLYRISFRKSSSPFAINPATGVEVYSVGPYIPSTVIYYQKTGIKPEGGLLRYKFEAKTNVDAFSDYYKNSVGLTGLTGVIREYDAVVEAHLHNGDSSAGGNFLTNYRGANNLGPINDSTYTSANGYDILYVNNPRVRTVSLTPETGLDVCLATNSPGQFCTDQFISIDGDIKLSVRKGSLESDVVGGYAYTCPQDFSASEAFAGQRTDGTLIRRSEFTNLTSPITTESNLLGLKSGYMAVSFYDSFDKKFRDTVRTNLDPAFEMFSGLALSNTVSVKSRTTDEQDRGKFRAWLQGDLTYGMATLPAFNLYPYPGTPENPLTASLTYSSINITSVESLGWDLSRYNGYREAYIRIKITFDTNIYSSAYSVFAQGSKVTQLYSATSSSTIADADLIPIKISNQTINSFVASIPYKRASSNEPTFTIPIFIGILWDSETTKTTKTL